MSIRSHYVVITLDGRVMRFVLCASRGLGLQIAILKIMYVPVFIDQTAIPIYWTGDRITGKLDLVIGEKKRGAYPVSSGDVHVSPDGKHYALRSGMV